MNNPIWTVKAVTPHENYTLLVTFEMNSAAPSSGEQRILDVRPLLAKPIYAPLRELSFFMQARAECGTVVWSDDIDIAPEYVYQNSMPTEEPSSHAAIIRAIVNTRIRRGITQRELAELCGIPQPSIARLEAMRCTPTVDTLLKIMQPLGLTLTVKAQ